MDLTFDELCYLTEKVFNCINFSSLVPKYVADDLTDSEKIGNQLMFDKVVLLSKFLDEILNRRPLPF